MLPHRRLSMARMKVERVPRGSLADDDGSAEVVPGRQPQRPLNEYDDVLPLRGGTGGEGGSAPDGPPMPA